MGYAIFAIIIVAVIIVFLILGSVNNPLDNEMGKLQNWLDKNNFKITASFRSVMVDENTKR